MQSVLLQLHMQVDGHGLTSLVHSRILLLLWHFWTVPEMLDADF